VEAIRQTVYPVDKANKTRLLAHLMETKSIKNALVFTRTKHGANKVARDLEKAGISAAAIHGNKSQTARQQALSDFKAGKLQVLVATDIAARGLDIEELSCVVNYNLSEVPETYVHRIGRTGRAGREGIAIALCDYQEEGLLRDIEKLIKKQIPVVEEHPWPMTNFDEPVRDKHGKVRNPEDEEARSAARERSRERRAAEKQAAQAKASQPAEKQAAQPKTAKAQEPKAPKKAPQKGKKSTPAQEGTGVVPIPDLLPTKEERALREQQNERSYEPQDILKRTYKRPERKVIPSLSSVSLLPQVELKESFVRKSDLLDMDRPVKQIPKEDATSRLFAGNGEAAPQPEELEKQELQEKAGRKRRRKKGQKAQSSASKAQKNAPKADQSAKKSPAKGGKKAPKQEEKRVVFTVAQEGKKKRRDRGRPTFSEAPNPSRQKDSTEQKSLMKPYYLSDRRKG
jgi:ATP-dependent RNA helicase RhlE